MKSSSVIIPTKNRANKLRIMLESLISQTKQPEELIIIDQSLTNESNMIAYNLFNKKGFNTKLKYIHNSRITGLTQARNKGIEEATKDIIFFFDDDVVLKNDYIENILKTYEAYPEAVGIGGVITNYQFLNSPRIYIFNNMFFLGPFHDERREIFINHTKYAKPIEVTKLSGGVSSFKRNIFETSRFDENFYGYSFGEDIDFCFSLKGKKIITPNAKLEHNSESLTGERGTAKRYLFWEVSGWTYIHLKNRSFFKNILFIWLYLGWILRGFLGLLKGKIEIFVSLVEGTKEGLNHYKVWKNKSFADSGKK